MKTPRSTGVEEPRARLPYNPASNLAVVGEEDFNILCICHCCEKRTAEEKEENGECKAGETLDWTTSTRERQRARTRDRRLGWRGVFDCMRPPRPPPLPPPTPPPKLYSFSWTGGGGGFSANSVPVVARRGEGRWSGGTGDSGRGDKRRNGMLFNCAGGFDLLLRLALDLSAISLRRT